MPLTTFTANTTIKSSEVNANFALCLLKADVATTGGILFGSGSTATQNATKLFWDNTNFALGIGRSPTAGYQLDVSSATMAALFESSTGTNRADVVVKNTGGTLSMLIDSSTGAVFGTAYAGVINRSGTYPLVLATNGTERMRIDSTGKVGIGTTAPLSLLHVYGGAGTHINIQSTAVSGRQWRIGDGVGSSNGTFTIYDYTGSGARLKIASTGYLAVQGVYDQTDAGAANVVVDASGNVMRSTSSIKYKKDVKDYTKGLSILNHMRPVTYKQKKGGDTVFCGFIAEELDMLGLNEFVVYDKGGNPEAIHYGHMVALLTRAIQEISIENKQLLLRIEKLDQKVN